MTARQPAGGKWTAEDWLKDAVRRHYARRATGCCEAEPAPIAIGCCQADPAAAAAGGGGRLAEASVGCCTPEASSGVEAPADAGTIPSLGCGSPVEAAALRPGEIVLDLGSGLGRDLLAAARAVGPGGRATGVDMTTEMVERARATMARLGVVNAEVVQGEIEALPLGDASVDAVISNCVINLVPDKRRAFAEAFRVLRRGGRLVVSDVVTTAPLPAFVRRSSHLWAQCVSGAVSLEEYQALLRDAGFEGVEVLERGGEGCCTSHFVTNATLRARRPQYPERPGG